jgi:DNA-binding response OmpR family regulator
MQKRALIVDDETATCQLVEKVLTSVGIESLVMTKSAEAVNILQEGEFSLVFLSFRMAFPDGSELTRRMRNSGFNRMTPIVLMSDDQTPHAMSQGFEAGASFFLYKPIDKERLLRLVGTTQGSVGHERRRTRRVPLKSKVQLQMGRHEIEAETIDISMEGMLVKANKALPVGSSVGISLHLSKGIKPVVGAGCVVRLIGPNQMGIHLGSLALSESQKLQEFLLPLIATQ